MGSFHLTAYCLSWREVRAEIQGRNLEVSRSHKGILLTILLLWISLFAFLYTLEATSPGTAPPTVDRVLPHQLSIKEIPHQPYLKGILMEAFIQLKFPLLGWLTSVKLTKTQPTQLFYFISYHLIVFRQNFSLNLQLVFQLDWLTSQQVLGSTSFYTPPPPQLPKCAIMSVFYMNVGTPNSVPHTFIVNIYPT